MKKLVLLMAVLQAGCATIISGRHQEVQVISSPSRAKACTGGQCITTPGSLTLRRDTNHMVVVERDGYVSETVTLTSGVGPAVAGNIIFGGLIGGGIDMATGAAYKLYPETVNVTLRPMTPTEPQPVAKAPSPARETLEDRLQQLSRLREKNLISEEEYRSTRKRLLENVLTPALASKATSASVVVRRNGAKLYAEQGDYSKVVAKLGKGEILEVLSQAFGMEDILYQVRTQRGALGWVSYGDVEKH